MADVLYVGLQDDDKIVTFGIDAGAAKLVPRAETPAVGAPSVFAVSPDRGVLYVGYRGTPAIESCRIDSASGALTSLGRVATEHPPTYLAPDRAGKYLLSAYYQGGYALDDDARHARLRQVVGGGHARDATAHDHDVSRALSHRPEILSKSMRPVKPCLEPAVVMCVMTRSSRPIAPGLIEYPPFRS